MGVKPQDGRLAITPLTGCFGAQIDGLDLTRAISSGMLATLRDSLGKYKVLVFRDQQNVRPPDLLAFSELFGTAELEPHVQHLDHPEAPGVRVLRSDAGKEKYDDSWHTDGATRQNTQWITVLQGVDVPPYGRDTLFADMEAAFDRLSSPIQDFLSRLTALHSWGQQKPDAPPVEHQVVRADPLTGRKTLYVNRTYTRAIVGLNRAESDLLLAYFYGLTHIPELQLRVSWRPGTIVMWDNEKVQHYLVMDQPYPRTMHRVMVSGEPARRPHHEELLAST